MTNEGYSEVEDRIWWVGPNYTIHSDIVKEVLDEVVITKQGYIVKHNDVCFREFEVRLALEQKIEAKIKREEALTKKYQELLKKHRKGMIEPKIHTNWEEGNEL